MSNDKMIRKQIYLQPDQNQMLKLLAMRQDKTEAEIIREAVDHYISMEKNKTEDPLKQLIGLTKTKAKDGSTQHDQDLYLFEQESDNE